MDGGDHLATVAEEQINAKPIIGRPLAPFGRIQKHPALSLNLFAFFALFARVTSAPPSVKWARNVGGNSA
jgi:hypothetical protein